MIRENDIWRFCSHVDELGICEDQMVEHMVTGLQAFRRAWARHLREDETAFRMVQRQLVSMAAIEHPAMARIFQIDEVENYLCVVSEWIDGEPLDLAATRRNFTGRDEWIVMAWRLVRLLREAEQLGLAWDRLQLASFRLDRDVLRLARYWPVATVPSDAPPPTDGFLARIVHSRLHGLYRAEGGIPYDAGSTRLANLLFQLFHGSSELSVSAAVERSERLAVTSGSRTYSLLGMDRDLEHLILGLEGHSSVEPIRSLDRLHEMIEPLLPRAIRTRQVALADPLASIRRDSAPAPASPSVPGASKAEPASAASPKPVAASGTASVPMAGRVRDEDVAEDRSYLYPTSGGPGSAVASAATKPAAKAKAAKPAKALKPPKPVKVRAPSSSSGLRTFLVLLLGLVIVAGAVVGGFILVTEALREPVVIPPPVASFTTSSGSVVVNQWLELDASASSDSQGAPLRYEWEVVDLDRGQWVVRPNNTADAVNARLQFFTSGTHTLQLRVFNGTIYSDPVSRAIVAAER